MGLIRYWLSENELSAFDELELTIVRKRNLRMWKKFVIFSNLINLSSIFLTTNLTHFPHKWTHVTPWHDTSQNTIIISRWRSVVYFANIFFCLFRLLSILSFSFVEHFFSCKDIFIDHHETNGDSFEILFSSEVYQHRCRLNVERWWRLILFNTDLVDILRFSSYQNYIINQLCF